MSAKATQSDGGIDKESARKELAERFPDAEETNAWEPTGMVSVSFSLDDLTEGGAVPMVNDFDAPEGYTFDAVSLHEETRQMFVTFSRIED